MCILIVEPLTTHFHLVRLVPHYIIQLNRHRGLGNNSQHVRPVVYLTYSSSASGKEFRDSVNFGRKYFRKLGELVDAPLSREERAKRRRIA